MPQYRDHSVAPTFSVVNENTASHQSVYQSRPVVPSCSCPFQCGYMRQLTADSDNVYTRVANLLNDSKQGSINGGRLMEPHHHTDSSQTDVIADSINMSSSTPLHMWDYSAASAGAGSSMGSSSICSEEMAAAEMIEAPLRGYIVLQAMQQAPSPCSTVGSSSTSWHDDHSHANGCPPPSLLNELSTLNPSFPHSNIDTLNLASYKPSLDSAFTHPYTHVLKEEYNIDANLNPPSSIEQPPLIPDWDLCSLESNSFNAPQFPS